MKNEGKQISICIDNTYFIIMKDGREILSSCLGMINLLIYNLTPPPPN